MAVLKILTVPDPQLRAKAFPVEQVDSENRKLMNDLLETLHHVKGVGLAAIQVGIPKKVIVVDIGEREGIPARPFLMANPELLWTSSEMQITMEGCYSIPQHYANVTRPLEIQVSYLDENNQKQLLSAQGLLADCIQHEIDHLNGILFIDHLSSLKRKLILSKFLKKKKIQR